VIEKQEGRQLRAEVLVAEHGVHREAVAHPMGFTAAVNAAHVLVVSFTALFKAFFMGPPGLIRPDMGTFNH